MFKCGFCPAHSQPGEKMTKVVEKERHVAYVDERGRKVAEGSEIVTEKAACVSCAARLARSGMKTT